MSIEKNKAAVHRIIEEIINKGDISLVPELISQEYVYHSPVLKEVVEGIEGFKQMVISSQKAFPDANMTIEEIIGDSTPPQDPFSVLGCCSVLLAFQRLKAR